jgi:hypothetical protein
MHGCSHIHKDGTKCSGIGGEVTWGSYIYIMCHEHDNMTSIMDMLFEREKEADRKLCKLDDKMDELKIEVHRLNALLEQAKWKVTLLEQSKGMKIIKSIKLFYTDLMSLRMKWKVIRRN